MEAPPIPLNHSSLLSPCNLPIDGDLPVNGRPGDAFREGVLDPARTERERSKEERGWIVILTGVVGLLGIGIDIG